MEKLKGFFSTLAVIALCGGAAYMCFSYNHVSGVTPTIAPLANVAEYPIYDGRNVNEYYRSTLNDTQVVVYDEMKEAFLQFKPRFGTSVSKISHKEISEVFTSLILDHPEIYWAVGYEPSYHITGSVNVNKYIKLLYAYDETNAKYIKDNIEPKIQEIVDEANKYNLDSDKIQFVHDKLIEMGTYTQYSDKEKREYQSIVSIFESGRTVCGGFSYSFKLLMDRIGIESIGAQFISDDPKVESHIWNLVKVGDTWLNIDVTYDNSLDERGEYKYTYYLKDNNTFYTNHVKPENLPNE